MKSLKIATIASLLFAGAASADPLTVATGKSGGGYDKAAQTLSQRIAQRGIENTVVNMNGSDEISLSLCRNSAQVGYMQIDAFYARSKDGCSLKAVANYGTEQAYLLFPPKSKYDELSDLSEKDTVLVDTVGSGSELFFRTIQRIEKEEGRGDAWSKVSLNTDGLDIAPAAGEMGDVQAVVMVRKPNSPDMARLLDLGWTLGELWDKNIDDLSFNGQPLYASQKIVLQDGSGKKHRGYAYDVSSFVVVNSSVITNKELFGKVVAAAQ